MQKRYLKIFNLICDKLLSWWRTTYLAIRQQFQFCKYLFDVCLCMRKALFSDKNCSYVAGEFLPPVNQSCHLVTKAWNNSHFTLTGGMIFFIKATNVCLNWLIENMNIIKWCTCLFLFCCKCSLVDIWWSLLRALFRGLCKFSNIIHQGSLVKEVCP